MVLQEPQTRPNGRGGSGTALLARLFRGPQQGSRIALSNQGQENTDRCDVCWQGGRGEAQLGI